MLLALLAAEGAGAETDADDFETGATGAGLLTFTTAGGFAGEVTTGAGAGAETATTGFARDGVIAATLTGAGCGAGAGAGAGAL